MEWQILNNQFPVFNYSSNENIELIRQRIFAIPNVTIHVRGSVLEETVLNKFADLDLYIIFQSKYINQEYIEDLKKSLFFFGRKVDIHGFTYDRLLRTPVENFLFHKMSYYITGEKLETNNIIIDNNLIISFWKAYNPSYGPNVMYNNRTSRVCALKNLTRCFGLINLIENGIFSRNIAMCLKYAEQKDNFIYDLLIENWSIVDIQKPLMLKIIKDYLTSYQIMFEKTIGP